MSLPSTPAKRTADTAANWTAPSDATLRRFIDRPELALVAESCAAERALHQALASAPTRAVPAAELAALEDEDARANYALFLSFRDRLLAHGTLEACYLDLVRGNSSGVPPPFIDLLVEGILPAIMVGASPYEERAADMLHREQRMATEDGHILAADRQTVEQRSATDGLGELGRILRESGASLRPSTLTVLTDANAPYPSTLAQRQRLALDLTHEVVNPLGHGLAFTMTRSRSGLKALAHVLELWVAHFLGVSVRIQPEREINDSAWRWHLGLDAQASAILNDLYLGTAVAPERLHQLLSLFKLEFADPRDMRADVAGKPVYLGLAMNADQVLKIKPQNLLLNLPLALRQ